MSEVNVVQQKFEDNVKAALNVSENPFQFIYEGELESLRHFKEETEQVSMGTECGIGVKNYNDVKVGDQIEVFDSKEVSREL